MDDFFHIENSNVIFLRSDSLIGYANIYARLLEISRDCSGAFDVCQGWHPCKSYVGVYIQNLDKVEIKRGAVQIINDLYYGNIKAYLVIILFEGWVELYDLCTSKEDRSKGYAKQIIENALLLVDDDERVWLGIDIANPLFEGLARFYARMGFVSPYISNITPNGKLVGLVFVGLTHSKAPHDTDAVFRDILSIRRKYLDEKGVCNTNIFIPVNTCRALQNYVTRDTEYGGILRKAGEESSGGSKFSILAYPPESEVKGRNKPLYAVETPLDGPFSWHSHPEICYRDVQYLCFVGWPSGQDMAMLVFNYSHGLRMHFVVTVEGIYAVQMTVPFVQAWERIKSPACRNAIIYGIGTEFGESEKYRSIIQPGKQITEEDIRELFKETRTKYDTFLAYLQTANTLTFEELVNLVDAQLPRYGEYLQKCVDRAGLTENFTLFRVNFMPWGTIFETGFVSLLTYSSTRERGCEI